MSALERFKREYAVKSDYDLAMLGLVLEEHAHELAEKIRADIIPGLDEYGTREQQAEIDGRRSAADLIDPEVASGEQ